MVDHCCHRPGMFLKLVSRPQMELNVCRTLILKQRAIWIDDGGGKMGRVMRGRSWYLGPNLVYLICFKLRETASGIPPRRWGMQMNCVSKYDVHSQVAASLIVGLTAENRKLHLAARLREASATPDLVATEIEQIFGFPDRDRSRGRGGGHYPAGDTVTADTQKRHTDSNWRLRLPPLCPLSWVRHCCSITKAQIAPSPPFQLFVITCRFFVSINQLDGWSLHEEDIWAISGDLGLKFGKWRNIDQISETPKCYPV